MLKKIEDAKGVHEGEVMSKMNKEKILFILKSFRFLFNSIIQSEDIVVKDILNLNHGREMIYPCDIIDLRNILEDEVIIETKYVPLFSFSFAKKYLKRYPIFLVINLSDLDSKDYDIQDHYGGLQLSNQNELNIKNSLKKIIINDPSENDTYNKVNKILKDINYNIECIISNSIPGISTVNSKLSKNWYGKTAQTLPIVKNVSIDQEEIVKGPNKASFPFEVGMRVRDRRSGMVFPQEYGIIKEIKDNKMKVEWDNGKKKINRVYDTGDTIVLFSIIAEE